VQADGHGQSISTEHDSTDNLGALFSTVAITCRLLPAQANAPPSVTHHILPAQANQTPSVTTLPSPWPCGHANQPILGTVPPALLSGTSSSALTGTNRPPGLVFTPPSLACTPSPEIMLVTSPMVVSGSGDRNLKPTGRLISIILSKQHEL